MAKLVMRVWSSRLHTEHGFNDMTIKVQLAAVNVLFGISTSIENVWFPVNCVRCKIGTVYVFRSMQDRDTPRVIPVSKRIPDE